MIYRGRRGPTYDCGTVVTERPQPFEIERLRAHKPFWSQCPISQRLGLPWTPPLPMLEIRILLPTGELIKFTRADGDARFFPGQMRKARGRLPYPGFDVRTVRSETPQPDTGWPEVSRWTM